mmetsp:Transcript_83372/g.202232  ORF Transcript_83372/g.202232 Transcript_83372/m.202232 type:complete len:326 (-) Transcript_83372:158-1135(-)
MHAEVDGGVDDVVVIGYVHRDVLENLRGLRGDVDGDGRVGRECVQPRFVLRAVEGHRAVAHRPPLVAQRVQAQPALELNSQVVRRAHRAAHARAQHRGAAAGRRGELLQDAVVLAAAVAQKVLEEGQVEVLDARDDPEEWLAVPHPRRGHRLVVHVYREDVAATAVHLVRAEPEALEDLVHRLGHVRLANAVANLLPALVPNVRPREAEHQRERHAHGRVHVATHDRAGRHVVEQFLEHVDRLDRAALGQRPKGSFPNRVLGAHLCHQPPHLVGLLASLAQLRANHIPEGLLMDRSGSAIALGGLLLQSPMARLGRRSPSPPRGG